MTMQEYFDKTVAHLRTLEGRALRADGFTCLYLTLDKRKCAVGVHIPDGHPAQSYGGGVEDLIQLYPDLRGVAVPDHEEGLALAGELQVTHDNVANWCGGGFVGEDDLEQIADSFGLKYEAPE